MGTKAVFLDRDGTIIPETGARIADPEIDPLPQAVEAIKKLRANGFIILVVTNQAAIARGFFTEADLATAHKALLKKFADAGAPIDGVYYCPHLPDGDVPEYAVECDCRKPKPGLLLRAADDHNVDLARSYAVGDGERDIQAAQAAGCRAAVLVEPSPQDAAETAAEVVVPHVAAAADWILKTEKQGHG